MIASKVHWLSGSLWMATLIHVLSDVAHMAEMIKPRWKGRRRQRTPHPRDAWNPHR